MEWCGRGQRQRRSPASVGVVTLSVWPRSLIKGCFVKALRSLIMLPPLGGSNKRYRDPSVCLSHGAAVLGYRHAGCLQLSRVRTADPSADGRRSAASRTAVGGGHIVSPPGAITSLLLWCAVKKLLEWKHRHLGPNIKNILRQSYGYLTIMPKLRSTYDGRLIYRTSCKGSKAFLRYDSLAIL